MYRNVIYYILLLSSQDFTIFLGSCNIMGFLDHRSLRVMQLAETKSMEPPSSLHGSLPPLERLVAKTVVKIIYDYTLHDQRCSELLGIPLEFMFDWFVSQIIYRSSIVKHVCCAFNLQEKKKKHVHHPVDTLRSPMSMIINPTYNLW